MIYFSLSNQASFGCTIIHAVHVASLRDCMASHAYASLDRNCIAQHTYAPHGSSHSRTAEDDAGVH